MKYFISFLCLFLFGCNESEWSNPSTKCVKNESYTTMIMVGKVMVPQTRSTCVKYTEEIYITNYKTNKEYILMEYHESN